MFSRKALAAWGNSRREGKSSSPEFCTECFGFTRKKSQQSTGFQVLLRRLLHRKSKVFATVQKRMNHDDTTDTTSLLRRAGWVVLVVSSWFNLFAWKSRTYPKLPPVFQPEL